MFRRQFVWLDGVVKVVVMGNLVEIATDSGKIGLEILDGPGQFGQPGMFARRPVGKVR